MTPAASRPNSMLLSWASPKVVSWPAMELKTLVMLMKSSPW
jgi:hypothetical protein